MSEIEWGNIKWFIALPAQLWTSWTEYFDAIENEDFSDKVHAGDKYYHANHTCNDHQLFMLKDIFFTTTIQIKSDHHFVSSVQLFVS